MLWRRSRRTRSAEADVEPAVRRDGDPLALAHEHRGRRRLEDRRALELLPDGERVHPVNGHLDPVAEPDATASGDRKSTRLNSSHGYISYAVFCLKKKKNTNSCNPMRPDSHTSRGDDAHLRH